MIGSYSYIRNAVPFPSIFRHGRLTRDSLVAHIHRRFPSVREGGSHDSRLSTDLSVVDRPVACNLAYRNRGCRPSDSASRESSLGVSSRIEREKRVQEAEKEKGRKREQCTRVCVRER